MPNHIIAVACLVPLIAGAAPKRSATPVRAMPAVPSRPAASSARAESLIHSDLDGRDLRFITQAIDLGKALACLAEQASRAADPSLRGLGEDLVKNLATQSAVLSTVAEMKRITVPEGESDTEKRISEKCAKLEGISLDRAVLDAFLDLDRSLLTTYELGMASKDVTIRKLAEQTLPEIREHRLVVEGMAGTAPKRTTNATPPPAHGAKRPEPVPPPLTESAATVSAPPLSPKPTPLAAPQARPGFRTNVRLPSDTSPTSGR